MRIIIPKEISEKVDKIAEYTHYVEGEGYVFDPDAPEEIVKIKEEVDEWFEDHRGY